jgi:hypothetical protein
MRVNFFLGCLIESTKQLAVVSGACHVRSANANMVHPDLF